MSDDLYLDRYDRALALCQMGRLEDAEKAIREVLREDPHDPFAHAGLAFLLVDLDRADEALEAASTAVALAPDQAFGHQARSQAFLSLGRFADAETSAREAVRADPEDADSWVLLAAALTGQSRLDEARSAADRALSIEPDSEAARGLQAVALAMTGGGLGWKEAADQTLAAAPNNALAHAFSGQAHLLRGGERAAAERFREALRLDPESEFAQAGLAEALKAQHPLFRPIYRFFLWQERLSRGWKIALTIGPILAVKALRPVAEDHPLFWVPIGLWFLFLATTWLAVPIANVALRFSAVGRAVLPAEQKRSSTVFLAFVGAALLGVVLAIVVHGGFAGTAFACAFLAVAVGSAHDLSPRRKRFVFSSAIAAGIVAFVGGVLIPVRAGSGSVGAVIIIVAMLWAVVLIWTVRLS
jgi:Tfp pilus assembly protein PilF